MRNPNDLFLNLKIEVVFLLLMAVVSPGQVLKRPSAALVDPNGKPHSFDELAGSPAVINFWATWCVPCKDEMPRLQRLQEKYASNGIKFVAVAIDDADSRGKIPDVLKKRHIQFPVWQGASAETLKELDLGEMVPATVIVDADGKIIGRIEGEAREKDITSRLDWLLGGRKGKQPKAVQKNDW
ncbi:TlpA family protein disulfide reductase [Edaphobacter flagellatus]|uniref:TlpA family protein disulfide reductase n=1 Tax=Edaphobacter flagellatus TaxID=1933044 RepID=UPI0021B2B606|nr:TlpA disulfide reductase family protein [Edaphobacter flagellatus]